MDFEELFKKLYFAKTEQELDEVINSYPDVFKQENWHPLGDNKNNFGLVETQQSSPIAALIEKITNSIDAILMKKCYEAGINHSQRYLKNCENRIKRLFKRFI